LAFEQFEENVKKKARAEAWAECLMRIQAAEAVAQVAQAEAWAECLMRIQAAEAVAQVAQAKAWAKAWAKGLMKIQATTAALTNIQIKFVRLLKESGVSNESILKNTSLSKEELAEIENIINLQDN
jgi:hypothetical protein